MKGVLNGKKIKLFKKGDSSFMSAKRLNEIIEAANAWLNPRVVRGAYNDCKVAPAGVLFTIKDSTTGTDTTPPPPPTIPGTVEVIVDEEIFDCVLAPDTRIGIAGGFRSVNGIHRYSAAILNNNLTLSTTAWHHDATAYSIDFGYDYLNTTTGYPRWVTGGLFLRSNTLDQKYVQLFLDKGEPVVTGSDTSAVTSNVQLVRARASGTGLVRVWVFDWGLGGYASSDTVNGNHCSKVYAFLNAGDFDTGFDVSWLANATICPSGGDIYGFCHNTAGQLYTFFTNPVSPGGTGNIKINGTTRQRSIIRLNSNGSIDSAFDMDSAVTPFPPDYFALSHCMAVQSDGKLVVLSNLFVIVTTYYNNCIRLNTNGSLDSTFHCSDVETTYASGDPFTTSTPAPVRCIAIQNDGKILLGGNFNHWWDDLTHPIPMGGIVRLYANGNRDLTWHNPAIVFDASERGINHIVVEPSGTILVVGKFTAVDGKPRSNIARLDANGHVIGEGATANVVTSTDNGLNYALDVAVIGGVPAVRVLPADPAPATYPNIIKSSEDGNNYALGVAIVGGVPAPILTLAAAGTVIPTILTSPENGISYTVDVVIVGGVPTLKLIPA